MSIQILENDGIFHINGTLDKQNAQVLSNYILRIKRPTQRVILNLERVIEFDAKAAYILLKMFITAVHSNNGLCIIGKKNKKLLRVLRETETMHIWSQSRILK